jgi:RNA polymerase sigma-70 factor (ECF subfamily)
MSTVPTPSADLLVAHVGWIRELARHMVADAHVAEDIAQEACVAALEKPPAPPENELRLRAWLASVMRNALRQRGRSEQRREAREERAARSERTESSDRLVERVALERALAAAVLELDEPYRTTLLLRFFEDLPPREIARREQVSVNTVHSRITRGLARLRERFDREHGNRAMWMGMFVPLAAKSSGGITAVPATIGGWIVNAKVMLGLVGVVVIGTLVALSTLTKDETSASSGSAPVAASALDRSAQSLASNAPPATIEGHTERAPGIAAADRPLAAKTPANDAATGASRTIRGRVLDEQAAPLSGVRVHLEDATPAIETESGAGGRFELTTSATSGRISAASPRWVSVRAGVFQPGATVDPLVIVAPSIDLGGQVVDPDGQSLSRVRVDLRLPRGFETRFAQILEATSVLGWGTFTDDDGRFDLEHMPRVEGSTLGAVADGYQPASVACPMLTDRGVVIALKRPEVELHGALRGQVLDQNGAGVPEARVAAGLTSTLCDAQGMFAIDLERCVTADTINAVKAGFLPAVMERPDTPSATKSGWPEFVVLRLGGEALSIGGVVVDAEKKPKSGVRIWLADATPFGLIGRVPVQMESLTAGAPIPPQIVESAAQVPAKDGDDFMDLRMSSAKSSVFWRWMPAERDGSFEFDGLADRTYRLRVLDEKTLELVTSDPIRAGSRNVEIVMPRSKMHPRLAGRVVSTTHVPQAGVRVRLEREAYGTRSRVFGGTALYQAFEPRESVTTDGEGRFEFKDVPVEGLSIRFDGDKIVPTERAVAANDHAEDLVIEVELRCYIDVRLKPPLARADAIAVRDGDGQPLDVMMLSAGHFNAYTDVPLVDGRSGVVSVSPRTRTLLLLKNGELVEKRDLELVPGSVVVVEP